MADWFKAILDEVTTLVSATWTDVSAIGVMLHQDSLTRNVVSQFSRANNSDATAIAPPWAVIGMGKAMPEDGISMDAYLYRLPVRIWYIGDVADNTDTDTTPSMQEFYAFKANQLLAAFRTGAFTTFEVFGDDVGMVNSSVDVGFQDEGLSIYCSLVSFDKGLISKVA